MKIVFTLIFVTLLLSCANKNDKSSDNQAEISNQKVVISDTSRDSAYVYTGFYFLDDGDQGVRMQKDHSDEVYKISKNPFVSINNILRATAQKNVIQGHDTYGVTIVLDNIGAKELEKESGDSSQKYIAIVIANKLLYVVENTAHVTTGVMQIILVDYSEKEVNDMIDAIDQKR